MKEIKTKVICAVELDGYQEAMEKLEELNRELEKANSLVHELANMRITIIANLGQR